MEQRGARGQVNVLYVLFLLGLIVAAVWIWKRLPYDVQDLIVDYAVPVAALSLLAGIALWLPVRALRRRQLKRRDRERLIGRFERETDPGRRLELAFALIELNDYQVEGLERCASAMAELFLTTLRTALGDKQHRLRGMAASHLGVLNDPRAVPALLKALEDDHAYVRGCAALGLGRLRATEAKETLRRVSQDDWDQTVRSRAREALERMV